MSYSHLVDQNNEVSTTSADMDNPTTPALDISRLQMLLGRNLMVYQELELLMKELACIVFISAPLKMLDEAMKDRRERIQKLTLGGTVDDVMRLFEPYEATESSGHDGPWLETKLTIEADDHDKDAERQRLAELIAERNWLVHGSLRELCFSSSPQIQAEAEARIERQHAAAKTLVAIMRERYRHIVEVRRELREHLRRVALPTMIFQSQAQMLLADPKTLKQAADGSFLLQRLLDLIRGRGHLTNEHIKALRGIGFEVLLQEVEPRLYFEDRPNGERLARYGILPAE